MQRSFEVIAGTEPARAPGFTPVTSSMDVPRPHVARQKRKRRLIIAAASVLGIILITVVVSRLKPAAMSVDRAAVWVDTVKRGPMLRQVRGLGTLVPEDIRWIAAAKDGRVEKIVVRPGAHIEPDTLLVELSSPDLQQAARDAELQEKAAEAELTTLRATLQREAAQSGIDLRARCTRNSSKPRWRPRPMTSSSKTASSPILEYKTSIIKRDELANRDAIEEKRLAFARDSIEPQLAAKQAAVEQLKASAEMRMNEVENLHVRAGMTGVLQQLPVEVGQRVMPGTNIARVADPTKLKAQIKIAETQAKDIQINQPASIDTRNGIIPGHVIRVDPGGRTRHRDGRCGTRRRTPERRTPRSQRGRDDRARTARQRSLCRPAGLSRRTERRLASSNWPPTVKPFACRCILAAAPSTPSKSSTA